MGARVNTWLAGVRAWVPSLPAVGFVAGLGLYASGRGGLGELAVLAAVYVAGRALTVLEARHVDLGARVKALEDAGAELGRLKDQIARVLNRPQGR